MVRAAVGAIAGLAVTVAAAAAPALAGQHPRGPAGGLARVDRAEQGIPAGAMKPAAPWAHIVTGDAHTCGIRADGTLWCWGLNDFGQLGDGSWNNRESPQQVTSPARGGWASVTGGGDHTCATRTDDTLWCWGGDYDGQLGIGNLNDQGLPRPVTTPAPGGWASVAASGAHTCAIRAGGTLWCWGWNGFGQLGIGNLTSQDRPVHVT